MYLVMSARVTRSEACFVLSEAVPRAFRAQELRNPGHEQRRNETTHGRMAQVQDRRDIGRQG
jgi:hypothetical protein